MGEDTYIITIFCTNCNHSVTLTIPRGVKKLDLLRNSKEANTCKNCGCEVVPIKRNHNNE